MTSITIHERTTQRDITPYVTIKVGEGGNYHVFDKAFGEDITDYIYFVIN